MLTELVDLSHVFERNMAPGGLRPFLPGFAEMGPRHPLLPSFCGDSSPLPLFQMDPECVLGMRKMEFRGSWFSVSDFFFFHRFVVRHSKTVRKVSIDALWVEPQLVDSVAFMKG